MNRNEDHIIRWMAQAIHRRGIDVIGDPDIARITKMLLSIGWERPTIERHLNSALMMVRIRQNNERRKRDG